MSETTLDPLTYEGWVQIMTIARRRAAAIERHIDEKVVSLPPAEAEAVRAALDTERQRRLVLDPETETHVVLVDVGRGFEPLVYGRIPGLYESASASQQQAPVNV